MTVRYLNLDLTSVMLQLELRYRTTKKFKTKFVFIKTKFLLQDCLLRSISSTFFTRVFRTIFFAKAKTQLEKAAETTFVQKFVRKKVDEIGAWFTENNCFELRRMPWTKKVEKHYNNQWLSFVSQPLERNSEEKQTELKLILLN